MRTPADLISPKEFGDLMHITPQKVRDHLNDGLVPGGRKLFGRWVIDMHVFTTWFNSTTPTEAMRLAPPPRHKLIPLPSRYQTWSEEARQRAAERRRERKAEEASRNAGLMEGEAQHE